jgi:DNA-directed RNA polymerase subunit RPC12/RpoP
MKSNLSHKFRCPSCRGERLVLGNKGKGNFVPKGKLMMLGFATYAIACLDCGYLGGALTEDDRSDLEKKVQEG